MNALTLYYVQTQLKYRREIADVPQFRDNQCQHQPETQQSSPEPAATIGPSHHTLWHMETPFFSCVFFFHFIFFLSNIKVTTPPPALLLAFYLVQRGFLLRTSVLPDATLLCPCRIQPTGFITGMQYPEPLHWLPIMPGNLHRYKT